VKIVRSEQRITCTGAARIVNSFVRFLCYLRDWGNWQQRANINRSLLRNAVSWVRPTARDRACRLASILTKALQSGYPIRTPPMRWTRYVSTP